MPSLICWVDPGDVAPTRDIKRTAQPPLVIRFPTLLSDGSTTDGGVPAASTMRVAVILVVSVFAILTVKAGWAATELDSLKIDPSWAWVLGAVLGGKAVQSFAEWTGKN